MLAQTPGRSNIYDESVFKILMEYEAARSQRYNNPLTALRMALVLNKPSPGEAENAPLVLAAMLNARLRGADIPARIGDEFAVLLPNTDETGARGVCERFLRITPGTHTSPLGFSARVAVCIGVASSAGGPKLNAGQLMREAEEALKIARSRGPQTYHVYSDTLRRR
ncbi:MAG: diguanylate cyclase [Chloroflexota bacterium]